MWTGRWGPRGLPLFLATIVLLPLAATGLGPFPSSANSAVSHAPSAPALADVSGTGPSGAARASAAPVLSVTGLVPTAASLGWTASNALGFENYTLFESLNGSGGPWQTVGLITTQATTSYVVGSLTPGSTYWWQIRSGALLGSQLSNIVSGTPPGLAFLNVTLSSPTTAQLNWTNNATYGGSFAFRYYLVYEIAGTSAPSIVANLSSASTHQASVAPLTTGASYAFFLTTTDCVGGCGGTPTLATTQSNVVTLGTPEPLVASLTDERAVLDVGQSDLFTCTPSGGRSPYLVQWDNGNGTYVDGPSSQSFTFNASGAPLVRCEITDADHTISTAGATLTIDPRLTLSARTNRTTVDVGGVVSYQCTPGGGTSPYSTAWAFGDGGEVSLNVTTHVYSAAGPFVASCIVTDFAGAEVGSSLGISVSLAPSASILVNSLLAAPGTALAFNAHLANGSGNASAFAWTFGDGHAGTGSAVSHAFATKGNFTVTARAVDSNGVPAVASDHIVVAPIALTVVDPTTSVRTGTASWFNVSATGGAGAPYNYSWNFGDGQRAYGPWVRHSYASAGSFDPVLVVTDHLGATAQRNLSAVVAVVPPVAPPLTLPSWLPLLLGAIALVIVGSASYVGLRRAEAESYDGVLRWILPLDPSRTLKGVRVCKNCGTPNNAARDGCAACGAPITPSMFG
jgi:hypothetical protein